MGKSSHVSGEANHNDGTFGISTTTACTSACSFDCTQRVDQGVSSLIAWAARKGGSIRRVMDERKAVLTRQIKSPASFMASLEQSAAPPSSLNNVGNTPFVPAGSRGASKER